MPEDIELIGTVRDTDGRSLEIYADHGSPRIDWCGNRGFFDPVDEAMLLDYLPVAVDIAKDQRAARAAAAADDAQDPEAHTCGVVDLDDEGLCDVPGYCPACDALREAGENR